MELGSRLPWPLFWCFEARKARNARKEEGICHNPDIDAFLAFLAFSFCRSILLAVSLHRFIRKTDLLFLNWV